MALISDTDKATIRKHFEDNLASEVEIVLFTERESPIIIPGKHPCETCAETQHLLEELAGLSDRLRLTVHDIAASTELASEHGIDRVPAIILKGAAKGRVRFFGIPSGYEFSAFISDLVDTSRGTTSLSDETREFLGSVTEDVNIKVFTTPG